MPYNTIFYPDNNLWIEKDLLSALWLLHMAHQAKSLPNPCGHRVFFTDTFYPSHQLAHALKVMRDGEARMIGTVHFSNIDWTNRFYLQKAIDEYDEKPWGCWCLVRAYDEHPQLFTLQCQHEARTRDRNKNDKEWFIPPTDFVSPDCRHNVLFKDSKIVIFYTNDLDVTSQHPIMDGTVEEAICLCQGVSAGGQERKFWSGQLFRFRYKS